MYASGLCIDQQYLVPGLAALTGLADSLTTAARRNAAVRVLTLDLTLPQSLLFSDLAKRAGFGSFDLRRCSPLRTSRMADASYITVTTYLRFEFEPGYVRRPYLIYVDAGVLVRGELTEPLGSLAPDEAGAVRDEFNPAVGEYPALPGVAERWPHLRDRHYFNAGVLWTHTDHVPRIRQGVEQALIHDRRHILHNDQATLDLCSCDQAEYGRPLPASTGSRPAGPSSAGTEYAGSSCDRRSPTRPPPSCTSSTRPRHHRIRPGPRSRSDRPDHRRPPPAHSRQRHAVRPDLRRASPEGSGGSSAACTEYPSSHGHHAGRSTSRPPRSAAGGRHPSPGGATAGPVQAWNSVRSMA